MVTPIVKACYIVMIEKSSICLSKGKYSSNYARGFVTFNIVQITVSTLARLRTGLSASTRAYMLSGFDCVNDKLSLLGT